MKQKHLLMKAFGLITGLMAAGVLMTACTKGYDDDPAFESSVKNSPLKALTADDITVKSSADGSTFTFTWQVVHGAGGYEVKLYNISDPNNAILVKADTTDACTVTMPREDDTNYMVAIRAISNASLGNTEQADPGKKEFSTFTPSYGTIKHDEYADLKAYFDANPLPETPIGMLCFDLEGGKEYTMSGDIDFCRKSLKAISPRVMQEVIAELGGEGVARSWKVCGLFVDMLGILECESTLPARELETPYGVVKIIPPELALVERVLIAYYPPSKELLPTARKMMIAALGDSKFDWSEAERLAALPDFDILNELRALRKEVERG